MGVNSTCGIHSQSKGYIHLCILQFPFPNPVLAYFLRSVQMNGERMWRPSGKRWRRDICCINDVSSFHYPFMKYTTVIIAEWVRNSVTSLDNIAIQSTPWIFSSRNLETEIRWHTPLIPALGRLRQEGHEFEASLYHIERHCLKKQKQKSKRKEWEVIEW
jgi:hypothetical protein